MIFRWTGFILLFVWVTGCSRLSTPSSDIPVERPIVVCLGYADIEGGTTALRPLRPGKVVQVHVQEGDEVKAAALLVTMDDTEIRAELTQARANVAAAELRLTQAREEASKHQARINAGRSTLAAMSARVARTKIQLKRQEDLFRRNLVGKDELSIVEEQVREAESSEEAARAQLREIQATDPNLTVRIAGANADAARAGASRVQQMLKEYQLRAPSNGVILALNVNPGEVPAPGDPSPPILFAANRPTVVRAEVEQELVHDIKPGMTAEVRDEMAGEGPWKASVVRISRLYVRRKHRTDPTQFVDVPTVECLLRLAPGHPPLRIGQKLRVSLYADKGAK